MKFDKSFVYCNILNNIRSSSSRLPDWSFPFRIDTKHWTRSIAGNETKRRKIYDLFNLFNTQDVTW